MCDGKATAATTVMALGSVVTIWFSVNLIKFRWAHVVTMNNECIIIKWQLSHQYYDPINVLQGRTDTVAVCSSVGVRLTKTLFHHSRVEI